MVKTGTVKRLSIAIIAMSLMMTSYGLSAFDAQAIGISPPVISAESVLRGSTINQTVSVTRAGDLSTPEEVLVETGGEYAHYIDLPGDFTFAAGESSKYYTFTINPEDAATGDYEAMVTFTTKPSIPDGTNVGSARIYVITGATAIINFTVTGDEVIGREIRSAEVDQPEEGMPMSLTYTVANTGNVEWKPTRIDIEANDQEDATNTALIAVDSADIEIAPPGESTEFTIIQPSNLIIGSYNAMVHFYDGDDIISSMASQPFNVYKEGTHAQAGTISAATTNKTSYNQGEKIKYETIFENTGEVSITATLYIDVYRDGEYIELLRGEELAVKPGDSVNFDQILEFDEMGGYELTAYVQYGNKKTTPETVEININEEESVQIFSGTAIDVSTLTSWGLIIIAILFIIGFAAIIRKRKSQGTRVAMESDQTVGPVSPGESKKVSTNNADPS